MKILDKEIASYTLRQQQIDTFEDFKKHENNNKYFLIDIPVGSGKSLISLMISKYFIDKDQTVKIDLVTNSKLLQNQYTEEFKSISNLWGREGYSCNNFPTSCSQGKDFASLTKQRCENCPYESCKSDYMNGNISLTNMHMFITLHLYQAKMLESMRKEAKILIVDESHLFEQIFSEYISVGISDKTLKRLSFTDKEIKDINKEMDDIYDIHEMNIYLNTKMRKRVENKIGDIENDIKSFNTNQITRSIKLDELVASKKDNKYIKQLKYKNELENLRTRIDKFVEDYKKSDSNWVLDINKKTNMYSLQTVWAKDHMQKLIWSKYDKIIFLSGTILDKELFCFINGLEVKDAHYYNLPSTFPLKNRPIYYMPIGKMSYKEKKGTMVDMVWWLEKLLKKYQDKKGIIHTNTFEIANWIKDAISTDRFLFHDDGDRDYLLKKHYNVEEPTVIVSPSMTTGIDLKDDYGRFGILVKVPYPSLDSNKNKARLKSNQEWYNYMTVLTIIQSYGRNVRSHTDYSDFFILDSCFSDIMRKCSKYLPMYVQMAIKQLDLKKLK